MEDSIVRMLNSKTMVLLRKFYGETTVFNALGVERKETRHSSFLKWFFDPSSNHGMGYEPLRFMLRLYAKCGGFEKTSGEPIIGFKGKIMSGNYSIEMVEPIEVEKSTSKLMLDKSSDRIDIWMVLRIAYEVDGESKKVLMPIAIENKINSSEGHKQTQRYQEAMGSYIKNYCMKEMTMPVEILLSPGGLKPKSSSFTAITYQDLLDYVLEPMQVLASYDAKSTIDAYIRNLGQSAIGNYAPLAISSQERGLVKRFMDEHGELVYKALAAAYPESVKLLGIDMADGDLEMLCNLWNGNEDIFVPVVCVAHHEKMKQIINLFKGNNRDNRKYRVMHRGKEIFSNKKLSKVMAAVAIFKAYVEENKDVDLEDLRKAFPCDEINHYYGHKGNYLMHMFYIYDAELVGEHGELLVMGDNGKGAGKLRPADWDLKLGGECRLKARDGEVMCVKMWRKADFERLVNYVHIHGYDSYIEIEQWL